MPYYHCRKCHHEFEHIPYANELLFCDWCGAEKPIILEKQTPLERMANNWEAILDIIVKGN